MPDQTTRRLREVLEQLGYEPPEDATIADMDAMLGKLGIIVEIGLDSPPGPPGCI